MMSSRTLLSLTVIALLGGCMVGPDYKRPDPAVPATFSTTDTPSASTAATIPDKWWELYQDPVLNDLVSQTLVNNTDIRVAVARVEEADAYMREIGTNLLPSFDLKSNATRARISQLGLIPVFPGLQAVRQIYSVSIGTTFELDFWGKMRRARESARAHTLASHFARDTVYLSMTSLVAGNYLLLRSLDAQLAISRDNLRNREEGLVITQHRLTGGIASALDLHQAEAACTMLAAQIADLVRLRTITEHQLAVLTGVLDLKLAEGNIKSLPAPPVPPAGLPSSLLELRPDIRQAEADVITTNANIGIAKAALFPSITLTSSIGRESISLTNLIRSAATIWTAGVNLNMPVFDAGRLVARMDQATAQKKQSLASYEGAIRTAFREVNDALVAVRQHTEREAALEASQESARKALQIARNRYETGYSAYLDVLDAQRTYNDAALAAIQSRQARLGATVDLFKSLGGGWKENQQQKDLQQ
jgi:outer membrane protein, multidrug efflux system